MASATARLLNLGVSFGLATLLSGCASSQGPISSRIGIVGPLKASVAQLESDNQTLRDKLAKVKADNGRFEAELARQEAANGEMAARLDDAKELLAQQGGSSNALGRSSKSPFDNEIPPPVKTINRSTRKPPAASIPRPQVEEPPSDVLDLGPAPRRSGRTRPTDRDPGPQSRRDSDQSSQGWSPGVQRPSLISRL